MVDTNTSGDPFDQARRLLRESEDVIARFRQRQQADWRGLAGALLDDMLRCRAEAERCLQHSRAPIRIVALSVLSHHWKVRPDEKTAINIESVVISDPDTQVRAVAVTSLGMCYEGTNSLRIGRFLVSIVRDEREPIAVRFSAYQGLFALLGQPLRWPGLYTEPPTDFRFPEDADWEFVDEFAPDNEGGTTT